MAKKWLNLFFRYSAITFYLKQKLSSTDKWYEMFFYGILVILLELLFIIITLPIYFILTPKKLQERGWVFPHHGDESESMRAYIIKRKISIGTVSGVGGVLFLKLFLATIISSLLFGVQLLLAATQNWDFSTAGDYAVSSSSIEFVSGVARLKNLGGSTSGATTNSAFTSNATGWTAVPAWLQAPGKTNTANYQSTGGNTGGYIDINLPGKKSNSSAGYWYQAFTTTVDSPDTATLNLDWKAISITDAPTSYRLYAFIGTDSGNPTVGGGNQVWDSGNITAATSWASISAVDIKSKLPTAGTYYLKIAAYVTCGTLVDCGSVSGFDNVIVNWSKVVTSYDSTNPTVMPSSSLSMTKTVSWNSFAETATKNGGEIYYQLSDDNGSTWKYWTGSAWAVAGGSNYNIASDVNTYIANFATSSNQIKFKAFLTSNGTQQVILDNVAIGYTENLRPTVTGLTPVQNTQNGYVFVNYNLQDVESDISSLANYEYSLTGAFAGEQVAMTASTTDPSHNGISGLTSSPSGTAHTFVWDAKSQLGAVYNTTVYVRLRANDGIGSGEYSTSTAITVDYVNPAVTNVSAIQPLNTTTVQISYDLSDNTADNLFTDFQVSGDGGSTWVVPVIAASGAVGSGVTTGNGKIIYWDAGTNYSGHQQSDMQVRVRAKDKWQNLDGYITSTNFSLDTLAPATLVTADLKAQPNAGDTTVLVGGSFTEANPSTNTFYAAVSGGAYDGATLGTSDTASPSNQATTVSTTLKGNNYISKVKITHTDDYGQSADNENLSPSSSLKYVKPYTPGAPILSNPITNRLNLTINPNASEVAGLEYAIYETSTAKYVQADGTLGASPVWRTDSAWGTITVTGLNSPVSQYAFQEKSRNTSDAAHAVSSESAYSATAQIPNTAPSIALNTYTQTTDGTNYTMIAYTGTDGQGDISNLSLYEYSQDNSTWYTMTEKSGVGSSGINNLTFLPTGSAYNFAWNSGTDLSNTEDSTVYVRLRPNDSIVNGSTDTSAAFGIDNKLPVVSNVTALQGVGTRIVTFTYNLTESNISFVDLQVSSDGGSTWIVPTTTVSGAVGSGVIPGAGKTITWNVATDFNNQYNTNMMVRIRARDSFGNQGVYASSSAFTVDTHAPVISNITATQDTAANTFTFHYDVSEDAGNATIVLAISSNGGSTWIVPITSAVGDIGSVAPGTGKTITWNGAIDYNNQEKTEMRIRLTADDQYNNSSNLASSNFSLDTLAPRVTSVVASQPSSTTTVTITYNLADQNNSTVAVDVSSDGGTNWDVATSTLSGHIGGGQTAGAKTITWNPKIDFNNQTLATMKVRVRANDIFNNQSANTNSSNFSLDSLPPATLIAADLKIQPNAGDSTVLVGGSFTEANPDTNDFYVAIDGGAYGSATAGTGNTASPSNQATAVGITLKGNNYISKVKITHVDDFGQTVDNENNSPSSSLKYVKPYTPQAPIVDNPNVGTVDVTVVPNANEVNGLEYAIYENTTNQYVQSNGTLGASAVWQALGTGAGQWGNNSGVSAKVAVSGLTKASYKHEFQVKSRNTSDGSHAASSESALGSGASSVNQSPTINYNSLLQTADGTKYMDVNYNGIDLESETSTLVVYKYSTDGTNYYTMTEKSGVGSNGISDLMFVPSPGAAFHFMWDVNVDLPNTEDSTVYVKTQANDGTSSGGVAISSNFTVDTKSPVISSVTASQTSGTGNVVIGYTLTDLSTSTVVLNISNDGGSNWTVATTSVTGDIGSGVTPGSGKSITWNAGVDFSGQEVSNMKVQLRATDAYRNIGSPVSSANFAVDTKSPVVSSVSASQLASSSTVNITYTLADANDSFVSIEISQDNGSTWDVATTTLAGAVGAGVAPGSKTVTWNAGVDFASHQQSDMVARVRAVDTFNNASGNVDSSAFAVDTSAPGINTVVASQTLGTQNVTITYNLVDANNATVAFDVSSDGGSTWVVPHTSVTGDVGAGIVPGSGKTITWNAGADYLGNQNSNMMVRVRGTDTFNNTSANVDSAVFGLDTLAPTTNVTADLQAQPNAGDTTTLVGGSFTEANPDINNFFVAINGGVYGPTTTGQNNTASPANQSTNVGVTLTGNDYISKVKIIHTDDYGQSAINQNTSPNAAYKYVKPYTPSAPTVNNPQNTSVDLLVNAHASESASVEYAILEVSTGKYVQTDGTLASSTVWKTLGTGFGQWGYSSGVAGKITVNGLVSPVANYSFKVKSRNPSDTGYASSSESELSNVAGIANTAPTIAISSAGQSDGISYVVINYTGTDGQNDTNNLSVYEFSTNTVNWQTMTEKSGVGSDGISGLIFSSTGTSYSFAWDITADLPNADVPTVYARFQSSDTLASSNLAVSSAFAVDTLGPVISNIIVSQTSDTNNVVINYDLTDNAGNNNTVAIQISSDSGSTWTVPTTTLTGDVGSGVSSDAGKSVTWNAGVDFNNQENSSMKVRIVGADRFSNVGTPAVSSNFTVDTKSPVVSAVSASQTAGSNNVTISYTLTDLTTAGNFVEVEISSNGGSTWVVPTSTLTGDVGAGQSTGGKTVTWNAGVDFDEQEQADMRVRVRARDYFANQGAFTQSANFTLDTKGSVISNLAAVQNVGSTNVVVTYDLSDLTTSSISVELEISDDGGSTWTVPAVSVIGDVGTGQTVGNGKIVTWFADTDFDGQFSTTMQVRVRATDSYTNQGGYSNSSNFTLDTANPVISNLSASQTTGSDSVVVHYDLADDSTTNLTVQLGISSDNGATWTVATSTLAGNIGSGQSSGVNKTVTWDAGVDFNDQDLSTLKVRVRAIDKFTNQGNYLESASFALDTKDPVVTAVSDLSSQPNGGDTSVVIEGSFSETNPNTNQLYVAISGGVYSAATTGTGNVSVLTNQVVNVGTTLQGDDYISKVKIVETDTYNHSTNNENTSPDSAFKYVKPYTPAAPTVDNSTTTTVDVSINKNPAEVSGLEYAIFDSTTGKYVQADGTLNTSAVWQTGVTWSTVTVSGLSSPVSQYVFKTKSRNSSDASHAVSSESSLSAGASAGNTAPNIAIDSVAQVAGNNYVLINYTGTDLEGDGVNLVTYQYSLNNIDWSSMTEKSGVGSSGKNSLVFSPTGTGLVYAWDAAADLSNVEDATVYVRLLGNDGALDGNLAISSAFALDLKAPQVSNVTAVQTALSRNVTINYDLADLTATNLLVAFDISSDNGTTWNVATTTVSGHVGGGQSSGSSKTITWNAGVDFDDQFNSNLKVRVRARDSFANQSSNVESATFVVDTKAPVVSNISASQTAGTSNIGITYDLTDNNGSNLTVVLDISSNNGATWTVATSSASGNIGGGQTTGLSKSITWDAGIDFANQFSDSFLVRLRALDTFGNQSNNFNSLLFTVDTQAPVVSSVTASQSTGSGVVVVNYSLADGTATNNTVEVGISDDNGATWSVATTSISGDVGNGQNIGVRTFAWSAGVDFANEVSSAMKVRVRARDSFGNQGSYAQSLAFNLDTKAPVISNVVAAQTAGTKNILISYDLSEDATTSTVVLEVSDDGGLNWVVAATSLTGAAGNTQSGNNKTITWNAGVDFANQEKNNMRVRLRASDELGNLSSNYSSSDFALDTKAPAGLVVLSKFSSTTSTVTLNWSSGIVDTNFDHYEIWHGSSESDVQSRLGTASKWSVVEDSNLNNINTISTVLTGLSLTGNYYVKIWAIDSFGNESTATDINVYEAPQIIPPVFTATGGGALVTTITLPPSIPILTTFSSPVNTATVVVSGLAAPRARIDLYDNGVFLTRFASVVGVDGVFSQSFSFSEGSHFLAVRAVDFNNNASPFSDAVNLVIDLTAPIIPSAVVPAVGEAITVPTPVFRGLAEPNTTVRVNVDGNILETAALEDGAWSIPLPSSLSLGVGPHVVVLRAIDSSGNQSPDRSINFSVAVPPTIVRPVVQPATGAVATTPLVPGLIEATEVPSLLPPQVTVVTTEATTIGNNIVFQGTALPNQEVVAYINSERTVIYRTLSDSAGVWKISHSQDTVELQPGSHSIYTVSIDPKSKVKTPLGPVRQFVVSKSFWVNFYQHLNLPMTIVAVIILLLAILFLYRVRRGGVSQPAIS